MAPWSFEITLDDTPDRFRDSLINIGPFKTIAVTLTGGQEKKVSLFRKKYGGETMAPDDDDAIVLPFDPDRFYLHIDGDSNWYVCQYYQWNKLLKTPSYFIPVARAK